MHEYGEVGGEGESGNMRVFEGFIEEKIKQARRDGVFNNVKGASPPRSSCSSLEDRTDALPPRAGRGKPMPKDAAESNPFISRTEFLMNRILKEQEAAPPWIEMQKGPSSLSPSLALSLPPSLPPSLARPQS